MKRAALFAFAFAGLAACDAPPSAPSARPSLDDALPSFAVLLNERFEDLPFLVLNPCPPTELVAGTVTFHVLITGDPGSQRFHQNVSNVHGVGLTSGDRYTVHQNVKQEAQFSGPNIDVETKNHFRIIRQGSGDNFDAFFITRFTSPPPMFEIIRADTECRG